MQFLVEARDRTCEVRRARRQQIGLCGAQHRAAHDLGERDFIGKCGVDETAKMIERVVRRVIDAVVGFTAEPEIQGTDAEVL